MTVDAVLAVQSDFYSAFERADFQAMLELWGDDDGIVLVHPGSPAIRGRGDVMRSWVALMADPPYIQFFITDVQATVTGDLATVTCTENVLSANASTPEAAFAGGTAVATNVFRRTPAGWRLWVHHSSPVLSRAAAREEEP